MTMKTCTQCKNAKPLSEYYQTGARCKDCTKGNVKANRIANLERIREYDRERGKLPHRLALNLESTRNSRKRVGYMAAHNAVSYALRSGRITKKPCQMCGTQLGIHAHHDDYTQPLNVMWLCVVHHKGRHAYLDYLNQNEQAAA
jgi:hypothetical protein